MVSGLVFGFIDNFGLFMGMKYLDPILSKIPLGDEDLMIAGSLFPLFHHTFVVFVVVVFVVVVVVVGEFHLTRVVVLLILIRW